MAQKVAKIIHDQIICRWGVPATLISVRGANYMSALMKNLDVTGTVKNSITLQDTTHRQMQIVKE